FFFFSSRRRHTRWPRDWSSDVCSSDLSGTLNTAAAYVASDIAESVLKPIIGRERPHIEGNSHRFHPFTSNGDWHSLPSAHVAHIASIAEAISMQSHSTSLTALCSGIVALV